MIRDRAEPTMVVGEDEAFLADHFSGATAAEQHGRVLQAPIVQTIDVLRGDHHAFGAHLAFDGLQQCRQPHAFMGLQK